MTMNSERKILP